MTRNEFIEKAKTKHGNKYDYSLITKEILKSNDEVEIICHQVNIFGKEHDITKVNVGKHLYRGDGCTKCSGRYKRTKEDFLFEANIIHNNQYTYNDFEFVDMKTKSTIHCEKHNIDFQMSLTKHLQGQVCPMCRYEKSAKSKTRTQEWFNDKVKTLDRTEFLDFSKSVYKGYDNNIAVLCHKRDKFDNEHGVFFITPSNLFHKTFPQRCPKCARERTVASHTDSFEDFERKATLKHRGRYNYNKSKEMYVDSQTKILIKCNKCGEYFLQKPANHLYGHGCPFCNQSQLGLEIYDFLNDNNISFKIQHKFPSLIGNRRSVDFYLPEYNAIIECQGKQHFIEDDSTWDSDSKTKASDKLKFDILTENNYRMFYYSNMYKSFPHLKVVYPYKVYEDKEKLLKDIINNF